MANVEGRCAKSCHRKNLSQKVFGALRSLEADVLSGTETGGTTSGLEFASLLAELGEEPLGGGCPKC